MPIGLIIIDVVGLIVVAVLGATGVLAGEATSALITGLAVAPIAAYAGQVRANNNNHAG